MTNSDKIRQMTDEELAEVFAKMLPDCMECRFYEECIGNHIVSCYSMNLKWLQQEATDD